MTDSHSPELQPPTLLRAWEDYTAACREMFERFNGAPRVNGGGPVPFELFGAWKDFAELLGMRADSAAAGHFKPEEMFAGLSPALGLSREYQEIGRKMLELTGQFQRQYAEFARQGADIGQGALRAFQTRISGDESVQTSPPALYDAWIDSAEEAYAGAAHSEPFARLLADLCNTLSAFKVQRGKLLEALARHFDWPSRAEVDSLHRRVSLLTAAAKHAAAAKIRKPHDREAKPAKVKPAKAKPAKAKLATTKASAHPKSSKRALSGPQARRTSRRGRR